MKGIGKPRRGLDGQVLPAFLLPALVALFLPSVAPAVRPDTAAAPFAVPAPPEASRATPGGDRIWSAAPAWRAFAARRPGWVARWDARRGVPLLAHGPALSLGSAPQSASGAAALARRFLAGGARAWVDAEDLHLVRAVPDGRGWWVQFAEARDGVRIVDASAVLRITPDGRLVRFGLRTWGGVGADLLPEVSEAEAQRAAAFGLPADAELEHRGTELVLLSVEGAPAPALRLAWEVTIFSRLPDALWLARVDAKSGALIAREDRLRHAAFGGTVRGFIEPLQAGDPQTPRPFSEVQVTLGGPGDPATAKTDADGAYALAPAAPGPDTLRAGLDGPYAYVYNDTHEEFPSVEFPVDTSDPAGGNVTFDDAVTRIQDRNAFYWAVRAHAFIKGLDPSFTGLDYPMPLVTDLAGRECNAFWSGFGLFFYPEGPNCTNTARSASVVAHEYGHGVTDFQYRPSRPSWAMHEGWSDYFSATLLDDPVIGHGFFGPGTAIRRIDGGLRQPGDLTGESHHDGLILAGALWDARRTLGPALADSLWHFARYGLSETFDDYFFDLLLTDDDDGNVYDGTPHFDALVSAFRAHGIGDTTIHVAHVPLPDTEDPAKPLELRASFLSLYPIETASVTAHVEIRRGESSVTEAWPMLPTGEVREFAVPIPPQAPDTGIRYWFTASDTAGTSVTLPPGGGADPFVFRIGTDREPPVIVHAPLRDQPLDARSRRILAAVTDNLDRGVDSVRVRHARNGGPEAVVTARPLGEGAFEALLPLVPAALGDSVRYRIEAADSAGTPNRAALPAAGWASFAVVRGLGRDFESDDGGLTAVGGDWTWGTPPPPETAYSGEKIWDTGLGTGYADGRVHRLELGPVDLSEFSSAGLFFRTAWDIEPDYDGGTVYASRDAGETWELLRPDGDYPAAWVEASSAPAYSGRSGGWREAAFDLSAFLGEGDVRFRFDLVADEAVTGPGWSLDDLEVVERQVLSRPLGLHALSGRDRRVPLRWSPPAGIPVAGPVLPIRGYRVHRAAGGAAWEVVTPAPIPFTSFDDTTVVNGTRYDYAVAALYDEGESALSSVAGAMPYLAVFSADTDSLVVVLPAGRDTVVTRAVANAGTGTLRVNAWPAPPDRALDGVRIRWAPVPLAGGGGEPGELDFGPDPDGWSLLFDGDPAGDSRPGVADLRRLEGQVRNGDLYFRISAHGPWGDPYEAFMLAVALDVDENPETAPETGEYRLFAGASVVRGLGPLSVILDAAGNVVTYPHYVIFEAGGTEAVFGFSFPLVGEPEAMLLRFASIDADGGVPSDAAPDQIPLAWLDLADRHLEATPEVPASLPVGFSSREVPVGTYRARIVMDTGAPATPGASIDVRLTVATSTPVVLLAFTAESDDLGVRLRWTTARESDPAGFHVLRRDAAEGPEMRLTDRLLAGDGSGDYGFIDGDVIDGRSYFYRLAAVGRDGGTEFWGPVLVHFAGASGLTAPVLRPVAPNPSAGEATLRFGLPAEGPVRLVVFGADGGVVRTLVDGGTVPRGFHEIRWDGRDDAGRRVAGGLYICRLMTAEGAVTRKLVVAR